MNKLSSFKEFLVSYSGSRSNFNRIVVFAALSLSVLFISDGLSRYYETIRHVSVSTDALNDMQNSNNQIRIKISEMHKEINKLKDKGYEHELFKNTNNVTSFVDSIKTNVGGYHASSNVRSISSSIIDKKHSIFGIDLDISISFSSKKHGTNNFYKLDKIIRSIENFPMKKEISYISISTAGHDVASVNMKIRLWSGFKYE